MDKRDRDEIHEALSAAEATMHEYPQPGGLERRVMLRNSSDEKGSRLEQASLDADGTLRVLGEDEGPGVSNVFGGDITSYEWVYVVAPDRVDNLITALGGEPGDDVLALLADHHTKADTTIDSVLKSPQVAAQFNNWHS